jgi:hypothetical protein
MEQIEAALGQFSTLLDEKKYAEALKAAPKVIGRFKFYWQHPNEAARVSFKSGLFYCVVSIVTTVVTTLISILLK